MVCLILQGGVWEWGRGVEDGTLGARGKTLLIIQGDNVGGCLKDGWASVRPTVDRESYLWMEQYFLCPNWCKAECD